MFLSTKNYTKYPPKDVIVSNRKRSTVAVNHLCIVNLCRLSRKSDSDWENIRSTPHDTSLAYL
jgi:hypothetical protein